MNSSIIEELQQIIDRTQNRTVQLTTDQKIIFNKGVSLLNRREHSIKELTTKLKTKFPEIPQEIIDKAIGKLVSADFLNEDRYKKMIVRKHLKKGDSFSYIKNVLSQQNIELSREDIDEERESLNISVEDSLSNLVRKKLQSIKSSEDLTKIKKKRESAIRYLLNKGHSYPEIKSAIDLYLNE